MSKSYNAIQRRSNFMTHISKKISFLALLIQTVLLISTIQFPSFRSVTSIKLITISEISFFGLKPNPFTKTHIILSLVGLLIPIVTFLIAAFVFSIIFMGYFQRQESNYLHLEISKLDLAPFT
jgi:hypothetical protein